MLARGFGRKGVMNQRTANAGDLVGCDRHANSCTANQDAPVCLAFYDFTANRQRIVWIVNRIRTMAPDIFHFVTQRLYKGYDLALQSESGMVRSDRNFHFMFLLVTWSPSLYPKT